MKQKGRKKFNYIAVVSAIIIAVVFFAVPNAYANSTGTVNGCTITIKSMEIQPQNVATSQTPVKFYADVAQSGTGLACQPYNQVYFIWYASYVAPGSPVCSFQSVGYSAGDVCPGVEITRGLYDFTTKTEQNIAKSGDLSNVDFSQLANPAVMPYYMVIQSNGQTFADTKSWNKTLSISGQTSSGGANLLGLNIKLDKTVVSPDGGDLVVTVNAVSASDIQNFPSQIALLTYVNGKQVGNNYGSKNQGLSRDWLQNDQTFQQISPTAQNGFQNGPNSIRVDVQDAGAPYRLYARATATVQGQGYSATGTGNPPSSQGTGNPPTGTGTGNPPTGTGTTQGSAIDCSTNPNPNYCFVNPLPVDNLTAVLLLIMKGFLGIIAIWAVAFIVIGGFRMVISQGNEEAVTAARKTITWAILGLVIASLSFSIIAIVQSLLQSSTTQNVNSANKTGIIAWKKLG